MTRALRADAERNRQRLLEVARQVFAAEGLAVPIDVIAKRAGLGVGTLYRHFPTKEALFEAIVVGRMEDLVADARGRAKEADAGAAFFAFFTKMVESSNAKKDFIAALVSTGVDLARITALKQQLKRAMSLLLERAQRSGAIRKDVDVADVHALTMAAMGAPDKQKVLAVVFDGLRPPAPPTPSGGRGKRRS
jgi:AcrR family transcriptional regulator